MNRRHFSTGPKEIVFVNNGVCTEECCRCDLVGFEATSCFFYFGLEEEAFDLFYIFNNSVTFADKLEIFFLIVFFSDVDKCCIL